MGLFITSRVTRYKMNREFILDKIKRTEADLYALQGALQAFQIVLTELDKPEEEKKED